MKVYKNQNAQSASEMGLYANYAFASDSIMSPLGLDITELCVNSPNNTTEYQVTQYDKETKLARIMLMNKTEFKKWQKDKII